MPQGYAGGRSRSCFRSRTYNWVRDSPLTQDIVIGHVQYLLRKA